MDVQIFGTRKSAPTRDALRFFAERRVAVHFVDIAVRPPASGELRRFAEKFGIQALVDREGKRYRDLGLGAAHRGDPWWLDQLTAEPLLLRLPLVRAGKALTVGPARDEWLAWLAPLARPTPPAPR